MEPTDAARVTALWRARLAREAGGLVEPSASAKVTGPGLARLAAGAALVLASGEEGLGCSPLAGLRAERGATRALAGRLWHKPGLSGGALILRPGPGRWEKEDGSQGTRSGEATAQFTLYVGGFFARVDADSVGALRGRGLARACQGFRWPALALPAAGRRTPRALPGRPWHRGRGLAGAVGKRGRQSRDAERRSASAVYPLRRRLFCETGCGPRWE